jgi:hypothetical protein
MICHRIYSEELPNKALHLFHQNKSASMGQSAGPDSGHLLFVLGLILLGAIRPRSKTM